MTIDSMPMNLDHLARGLPLVATDDELVMINQHYGLLWVFDEKGVFRRRVQLFDLGKDEDLCRIQVYWQHERAILGFAATPEGQLLLATRSAGAVLFARKDEPLLDEAGNPEQLPVMEARSRWSWLDRPDIWWWLVDPKSGKASRTLPPLGAPELMTEEIARSGVTWSLNRQGDPVFPKVIQPRSPIGLPGNEGKVRQGPQQKVERQLR